MNDDGAIVRPASLGRALRKGFRAAYDHLGYVVLVSFVSLAGAAALLSPGWKAAVVLRPGMSGVAFLIPGVFFYYLCAVGAVYFADKSIYDEHPSLADTWRGIGRLFLPALWLFVIDSIAMAILLGDAMFFLSLKSKAIGAAVGIGCLYLAVVWLMTAVYHLPLLPAQLRLESGPKPFVIVRKSFLLTVGSPGFTLGLFLAIIALAVLCALPAGLGTAMLFLGAAAFFLTHGLRELFVKYGVVEKEPDVVEDNGWPKG